VVIRLVTSLNPLVHLRPQFSELDPQELLRDQLVAVTSRELGEQGFGHLVTHLWDEVLVERESVLGRQGHEAHLR
jgi:hypothetical protein